MSLQMIANKYLVTLGEEEAGQRIDHFLVRHFKNVPKTRLYKALRKGEIRINRSRVEPSYRLQVGDLLRLPPLYQIEEESIKAPSSHWSRVLLERILYEDKDILVMNKPSGMAVHAGSGIKQGLIENLRLMRPDLKNLELVHRLDRETSGCLLIAKKNSVLRKMHVLFRNHQVVKTYQCLCKGVFAEDKQRVAEPLLRKHFKMGDSKVIVSGEGKSSLTTFQILERYSEVSLVRANLSTGRTHQIRAHAASINHPLVGDEKYGDPAFNQLFKKEYGLKRLFLHAVQLEWVMPDSEKKLTFTAPLDKDLQDIVINLKLKT